MMPAPDAPRLKVVCPRCHAPNPPDGEVCKSCGATLSREAANPYEAPRAELPKSPSYRLGTLMLVIVVVAINFAAFRAGPGFGLLVLGPTLIALSRTALTASRTSRTPLQHALVFAWSFTMVIVLVGSSLIAFMGTCMLVVMGAGGKGDDIILWAILGMILGLLAAGFALLFLLRVIRAARSRHQKKHPQWYE